MQNPTWLLKAGCPNLTKGRICPRREAAGGISSLPNLGASRWREDVKVESWRLLILTTAGEGWGVARAFDSPQRCCFALEWAARLPVLSLDLLTPGISVLFPLQTTECVIYNSVKYVPGKHCNKSYEPGLYPIRMSILSKYNKGWGKRECKENRRSRKGITRGKQEGCSLSLPSPTYKRHIEDTIQMKGKQRTEMCLRSFGLEFCHARVYLQNLHYLFDQSFLRKVRTRKNY